MARPTKQQKQEKAIGCVPGYVENLAIQEVPLVKHLAT